MIHHGSPAEWSMNLGSPKVPNKGLRHSRSKPPRYLLYLQAVAYDRKRQEAPQYKPGDLVLLNMKNIRTTRQMKKLDNLRNGPLEIMRKVGKASYQLKLPIAWTKAGVHPVFNETLLHPYHKPVFPS